MFPKKLRVLLGVAMAVVVGVLGYSVAAGLLAHYRREWTEPARILLSVAAGLAVGFMGLWIWDAMVAAVLPPRREPPGEDPDLERVREAAKLAQEGQLDVAQERMLHAASKSSELAVLGEALECLARLKAWDTAETILKNWDAKNLESPTKRATLLCWKGFFFLRQEKWCEVETVLREALSICDVQDIRDPAYLGDIQMKLGWALHKQGRHEDAETMLRRAIKNNRPLPSQAGLANGLNMLGTICEMKGDWRSAGKAFDEARLLSKGDAERDLAFGALKGLADVAAVEGKMQESIELIQQAASINERLGPGRRSSYPELLLCQAHETLGDLPAMEACVKAALEKAGADDNVVEKGVSRVVEGTLLQYKGQLAKAEQSLRDAKQLAGDGADENSRAFFEQSLVHVLLPMGKFDEAELITGRALDRDRRMNSRPGIVCHQHLLAIIEFERNDLAAASAHLREALNEYERMNMRLNAALAMQALAGVLNETPADQAEAEKHARRAEKTAREANWRGIHGNMMRTTASILENGGAYEEAERLYREALELDMAIGKHLGVAWSQLGLARTLTKRGEAAEAERLAREAMAAHEELGCRPGVAEARKALSGVAAANGNTQMARELAVSARDLYAQLGMRRRALNAEAVLDKLA